MPVILAAGTIPGRANPFSSPPPNPKINDPNAPKPPPVPHIPRKFPAKPPKSNPNRALKSTHSRTKYYKPVSDGVLSTDGDRAVVVGESGVSYLLPDAPFEFQFSYSETPKVKPLAIREPAFLPFAPPTMPRPWTGKAPLKSKKEKELKKQRRVRLVKPFGSDEDDEEDGEGGGEGMVLEMERPVPPLGKYPKAGRSRAEILGNPLLRAEVRALVKPHLSHNRQVNLGRDGLTHNMLELIHSHWRRQQVCKVRCRGVPTVDMDNICRHLEEKTGGKIIYRVGGVVFLFRGRNYDPHTRPRYPVMLWKPAAPVYPKLIQEAPEGLTKLEADELKSKGRKLLPICKLAKNGIYVNLVKDVRDAFEESPLVKINCQGLDASDYKKIGAKLKDLVPCVLLSFDEEQILMWRGRNWKSRHLKSTSMDFKSLPAEGHNLSVSDDSGKSGGTSVLIIAKNNFSSSRMLSLWNRAIETKKALLLDDTELSPDALLEKVEEFCRMSQAAEHSYPAVILSKVDGIGTIGDNKDGLEIEISDELDAHITYSDGYGDGSDGYEDVSDSYEDLESTIPFGSIPLDMIAKGLGQE